MLNIYNKPAEEYRNDCPSKSTPAMGRLSLEAGFVRDALMHIYCVTLVLV